VRGNRVHERMKGREGSIAGSPRLASSSDIECQSSYLSDKARLARISDGQRGRRRGERGGARALCLRDVFIRAIFPRPSRVLENAHHRVIVRRGFELDGESRRGLFGRP
jgi:hypothetical protein